MKRVEESITIDAAPSAVFAYVSDFERHGDWSGHGLEVTKETDGPVGVGTRFSTVAKQFGTQRERSTVTDMTSPTLFAWDSDGALGRVHHWFALRGDGGSTTLVKGAEPTEPTFLAKMMSWRIARDMPKSFRSDLAKIKAHLESGSK
jgi:hypothetical protein